MAEGAEQFRVGTAQTVVARDGRTVCFAEWGASDGYPVFSLHGTPGCRLLSQRRVELGFEDAMRSLGVRLITYDRPGYGRSDRQSGRSVADCASDVVVIADALELGDFAVEGGSSGAPHALAVAAVLGPRARRVACVAPMAPYQELGHEDWSRGQDDEVREYVACCLQSQDRLAEAVTEEDRQMQASASPADPKDAGIFEETRNGIWGWVDDELAVLKPWGFDPAGIRIPTALWHDPNDPVLPPQHAEWLGRTIPNALLKTTDALGHGSQGDPDVDWTELYSWLLQTST